MKHKRFTNKKKERNDKSKRKLCRKTKKTMMGGAAAVTPAHPPPRMCYWSSQEINGPPRNDTGGYTYLTYPPATTSEILTAAQTSRSSEYRPNNPLISSVCFIPLEIKHDFKWTTKNFLQEDTVNILNRLLNGNRDSGIFAEPETRDGYWAHYQFLNDNSMVREMTKYWDCSDHIGDHNGKGFTKNTFVKFLKNNSAQPAQIWPWPNVFNTVVNTPVNGQVMTSRNDFWSKKFIYADKKSLDSVDSALGEMIEDIKRRFPGDTSVVDDGNGNERMHLYYISDARHEILRYIKDNYRGPTSLTIWIVVSMETLADPGPRLFHDTTSFKNLGVDPNPHVEFKMIHDLTTLRTYDFNPLLQTKSTLTYSRDSSNNQIIRQSWTFHANHGGYNQAQTQGHKGRITPQTAATDYQAPQSAGTVPSIARQFEGSNGPKIVDDSTNQTTKGETVTRMPGIFSQDLYVAQQKRVGDHSPLFYIAYILPTLIRDWHNNPPDGYGEPGINIYSPIAGRSPSAEVQNAVLQHENANTLTSLRSRIFHGSGDWPCHVAQGAMGGNGILIIGSPPTLIIMVGQE